MNRRAFLQMGLLTSAALISGCSTNSEPSNPKTYEIFSDTYGAVTDGGFRIPAVSMKNIIAK
jgi:hypothetical protein